MFILRIMTNGLATLISVIIMIKMISLVTYPVGSTPPLANANESPSPTGGDNHHHPLYLLLPLGRIALSGTYKILALSEGASDPGLGPFIPKE